MIISIDPDEIRHYVNVYIVIFRISSLFFLLKIFIVYRRCLYAYNNLFLDTLHTKI